MEANTFGKLFRITTFGESHGPALGVVLDGCPSGLELDMSLIQDELERRKTGQSKLVSQRKEPEQVEVLSGVFEGKTTGTPIMFLIRNQDARSKDYESLKELFRPGHADFTYFAKYRHRDWRGGGRSSARETAARVIAGAVAKQLLKYLSVEIVGGVVQVGSVKAEKRDFSLVEQNIVRCPDALAAEKMIEEIERARKERDSVGGVVEVQALGVPPGLGEPVFARIEALLGAALLSMPAVKGVEFGEGFGSVILRGSQMNDIMEPEGFRTNHHGGMLGGISTGAPVVARIAIKPTSSLPQEQETITTKFERTAVTTLGRHDPCVAIRAVPIAEAMVALVLIDLWLQDSGARSLQQLYTHAERIQYGLQHGYSAKDSHEGE